MMILSLFLTQLGPREALHISFARLRLFSKYSMSYCTYMQKSLRRSILFLLPIYAVYATGRGHART
jgi:hypothetical protein